VRFTVTKRADLDEDIVQQVATEVIEWLGEKHLLNFPESDERAYEEVARDWVKDRNEVVR